MICEPLIFFLRKQFFMDIHKDAINFANYFNNFFHCMQMKVLQVIQMQKNLAYDINHHLEKADDYHFMALNFRINFDSLQIISTL